METLFFRSSPIPASEKISIEARNGARAMIGGLLNCQPSAPGIG